MSWPGYLAAFHQQRPGVTEAVLSHAHHEGRTPYQWLLEAVPAHGSVLDLACGSAPLWPALRGRRCLGVDASAAELALARSRGAGPLL
ncbi:MAG: class I SAM-dependent methyltransferase, partial [Streptomyces sp.]|nr:class I SAM-dependent methyltransferase [Streptomyces sp.]